MAAEPIFLDTSVIVPASVEVHPSHAAATAYVQSLVADAVPLCLSPQVCREFMVVLTRQPVSGRSFTVDEALNVLERWRSGCALLEETEAAFVEWLRLVRKHQVQGKQAHDCNIVAVMLAHGIRRLATRNESDFARYADEIPVETVSARTAGAP